MPRKILKNNQVNADGTAGHQQDWRTLVEKSLTRLRGLPAHLVPADRSGAEAACKIYPMRINAYYAGLIQEAGDGLGLQVLPDIRETDAQELLGDPLTEELQSPAPGIIHRYPDRVVFLISSRCPVLCRFCMRKRLAGRAAPLSPAQIGEAIAYIGHKRAVREVILSGGDPFMLEDAILEEILHKIRALPHVEIVRLHSRAPCALPQRITAGLTAILRRYHPLYVNIHVNHPDEVTADMAGACARLADAGVPLGSQSVLLKGVNDTPEVLERLFRRLLQIRVRPYYLHHPDPVSGTGHFRPSVSRGLAIMESLRGRVSGMALPHYMIDLPGGGGKVPLEPERVLSRDEHRLTVKNFQGKPYVYPG